MEHCVTTAGTHLREQPIAMAVERGGGTHGLWGSGNGRITSLLSHNLSKSGEIL